MTRQTLLAVALAALTPLLAGGAHCTEPCPPSGVQRVESPELQLALEGPAMIIQPEGRFTSLAASLAFDPKAVLHLEVSRPVVVSFERSPKGLSAREIATVERSAAIPLFPDAAAVEAARAAQWSALVLRPKGGEGGPWQVKARFEIEPMEMWMNEPIHGRCMRMGPAPPRPALVPAEPPRP